MKLFEIKNLKKSFNDVEVIRDISMSVEQGQVVAIIGPSGSGKSTLLRCATMLDRIDSGEIAYLGEHAVKTGEDGRAVYAPQHTLKKYKAISALFSEF